MKRTAGFGVVLLLGGVMFAQGNAGRSGGVRSVNGGFGSVAFPGGVRSTPSHINNGFGNVVFPGLSSSPGQLLTPNFPARLGRTVTGGGFNGYNGYNGYPNRNHGQSYVYVPYAYPVYTGFDPAYYDQGGQPSGNPIMYGQQPPQVTIINQMPPSPGPSQIVTVPQNSPGPDTASGYQDSSNSIPDNGLGSYYLIALKDHTIYSAVAYWVEGDTLHYFTAGNVHNQASLSLVDRELTERLNRERNIDVRLPH